jgi:hypothetical protein
VIMRLSLDRTWARSAVIGPVLCSVLGLAACSGPEPGPEASAAPSARVSAPDERTFIESADFLHRYWERPIPPQGPAPARFDELAASLRPEACGRCHDRQYQDWQTTIHSRAYSPGLSGQLVNLEATDPATVASCQACHTPLSEQIARLRGADGGFSSNPDFDPTLRDQGLVCAACHVRGNKRYGPPRRDGSLSPSPPQAIHAGVTTRTAFFEDSRFCSTCHQFAAPAVNGKSLQNTYVEWQESRYPGEGVSCQGCHMPDRRHLWRGIHDPQMVKSGVTIELDRANGPAGAAPTVELRIANTGTGHHFPSYVTPEVVIEIWFEDSSGLRIADAQVTSTIGRKVEFEGGEWVERHDTRIPADSVHSVSATAPPSASTARATVTVRPDEFYRGMFAGMLTGSLSDTSRALISAAHRAAQSSPYVIFDGALEL